MKEYPSITKDIRKDIYLYFQDKKDGSQIRGCWNKKKGFYKFGTRAQLIDENSQPFGKAIPLLRDKYENDLSMVFEEQGWREVTCFFEFFGPSSFAGNHNFQEEMNLLLFDVDPYKCGILPPTQFIKYFGHLDIPKILYEGHITTEIVDKIKKSTLDGMTFEGVVAKGANDRKTKMPIMFKIKSNAWLNKLKDHCKNDENLFNKLS